MKKNNTRTKLSILTLHLGYGGLERSVASLVNLLGNEYDIEIISIYKLYEKPPYPMNENIKIKYLIEDDTALKVDVYKKLFFSFHWFGLMKAIFKDYIKHFHFIKLFRDTFVSLKIIVNRKRLTKRAIRECNSDIIVSTRDFLNELLGNYGKKKAVKIAWEHNHHHGDEPYVMKVVKSCEKLDYLILVSDSLRSFYKKKLKESKCKCVYIPNMLETVPRELASLTEKRIVSVGRLSPEKGYGDLIEVFQKFHEEQPDWHLDIIGDGAQRNLVTDKIYQYNLTSNVTMHGYLPQDKISEILDRSSIYVMTSYTESFGLVLIEAMSHGLPCIAFSSAEGANDLIEEDKNGYLISSRNQEEMVEKMVTLSSDLNLRKRLGKKGREKSLEFTPDLVKKHWMKLLKK